MTKFENEPGYYTCPRCKKGVAAQTGFDTQEKRVFKCTKCDETFGEYALEAAAKKRTRDRFRED